MSKLNLSLAIALAIFGTAVLAGHPPWGAFTGLALLLLAAAMGVGCLTSRRPAAETSLVPPPRANPRISTTLVTMSSAAILAVYAAGYQRTRPAAEKFQAQERRRPAPGTPSPAAVQPPAINTAEPYPVPSPNAAPGTPRVAAREANPVPDWSAQSAAPHVPAVAPQGTSDAALPPPAANPGSDASADSTPPAAEPKPVRYKDGVYLAWGWCNHGNIQASVVISDGKILSTAIAVCATRYPCSVVDNLPAQVVMQQSTQVDFVSGATDSSYAFTDAVNNALSKALH